MPLPHADRHRGRRRSLLAGFWGAVAMLGLTGCQQPQQPAMADVPPPAVLDRRVILTANFDLNSYRLRPESRTLLDNVAAGLLDPRLAGSRFEINGHTDLSGRLGYNLGLSMMRAGAVMDHLATRGVPAERMRPQGFGPLHLIEPERPFGAANRRVEIVATGG
jgi:outer membrane protein OmpA-like peptidoglycan-associated protein